MGMGEEGWNAKTFAGGLPIQMKLTFAINFGQVTSWSQQGDAIEEYARAMMR